MYSLDNGPVAGTLPRPCHDARTADRSLAAPLIDSGNVFTGVVR